MRALQVSEREKMFIPVCQLVILVMPSTFIVQASNSSGIHNFFTIEVKVGDFYMSSRERGVSKPESVKEDII